jgi:hypothetical protein
MPADNVTLEKVDTLHVRNFEPHFDKSYLMDGSQYKASSAGAAVAFQIVPPNAQWGLCLGGLVWSYSADPSGGKLTVAVNGGATLFEADIIKGGHEEVLFPQTFRCPAGATIDITLAGGGGTIVGKLLLAAAHFEHAR